MRRSVFGLFFLGALASAQAACSADTSSDDRSEQGVIAPPEPAGPTATQIAQANELASMLAFVRYQTAWHAPVDWDGLSREGQGRILSGDGSDRAFFGALYAAFTAVPQGHQGLYLERGCGSLVPVANRSARGVCGRPHARGIVVTNATEHNPLGLRRGDVVVRIGAASGRDVLTELAARPMCTASRPSIAHRDTSVASTFGDLVAPGEALEVVGADGEARSVVVPDATPADPANRVDCSDPFSRSRAVAVEAQLRPDGVGVIRLPGFTDPTQPYPSNPTPEDFAAYRAAFEAKIGAAFESVRSARAIVWDIRGNGGGLTLVGLGIASGFPGARAEPISYCQMRVPGVEPAELYAGRYAEYALAPGGRFAYSGKVAILVEGNNYSAADYFPLAAKLRTGALLVGAPTAGGFGARGASHRFEGPPAFTVTIDANRCMTAEDGLPLEGRSVEPHVLVGYDPADLAAGRDTVLERAVAELDLGGER